VLTTGYWPSPAACNTLIIPEEVHVVPVSLLMIVTLLVDYCCLCVSCLPQMLRQFGRDKAFSCAGTCSCVLYAYSE
jgi:hypothetical protein